MKILVLNYEWPPLGGGAAPVSRDLALRYHAAGHAVDVATMRYRGQPALEDDSGVAVHRIFCLRRRMSLCTTPEMLSFVLAAFLPVRRLLRERRYDAIHCHFLLPTGLLAAALSLTAGRRFLVTVHGSDLPGYNRDRFVAMHRLISPWLPRWIARRAHRIVSPSQYLADHLRRKLGPLRVDVIPNGIDTGALTPKAKRRRIVMSGRLLPRKGFQHVLAALEGITGDWEVHIAGDGPMRGELEALARRCKLPVQFHGWLPQDSPQLAALYEEGRVFCLPSSAENASRALLEAMLAGLAVVTSNRMGCPETVGEAGVVVPFGEVPALRAALTGLLSDAEHAERLGAAARARVLEKFDVKVSAARYLELFSAMG